MKSLAGGVAFGPQHNIRERPIGFGSRAKAIAAVSELSRGEQKGARREALGPIEKMELFRGRKERVWQTCVRTNS